MIEDPACGTGQLLRKRMCLSPPRSEPSNMDHIVSQKEGHQPLHSVHCAIPSIRFPEHMAAFTQVPKTPCSPTCWDFCPQWLRGLRPALSTVWPWVSRAEWDGDISLFLNPVRRGHHTSSDRVDPLPHISLNQDCVGSIKYNWAEKKGQTRCAGLRCHMSETSAVYHTFNPHRVTTP